MTTELPLFPLHSVLCPGVALPLHIFEERYRLMIARCVERGEPFGVVLLREGREVGPLSGRIAQVGTTAVIRQAGRHPDGRMDIVTLGERRFRVEELDSRSEPYLVGRVSMLDEPLGEEDDARAFAGRVGRRFLEYLELLQPAMADDGPEVEIEIEVEIEMEMEMELGMGIELDLDADGDLDDAALPNAAPAGAMGRMEPLEPVEHPQTREPATDSSSLDDRQRRDLLMAAARRLTATGDPTALSYLITALVQVEVSARQELLETPDTARRLARLDALLGREIGLLRQGLRPLVVEPGLVALRRN